MPWSKSRCFRDLRRMRLRGCTRLEPASSTLPRIGAAAHTELATMDAFRIDELARRLLERVPPAMRSMQADLESNFRAVLRERLSKLDLVSRDEFDAQTRVLERTREKLEALEGRLTALEGGSTV